MITERDLQEAIAECQGERNPNANTCIKLAAFYTIKNELFGKPEQLTYSYAAPADSVIDYDSGTEFSELIQGRDPAEIWPIMDELMTAVQAFLPRLYDGTMRRLRA